jgi:hypothetical protein
MSLPENIRLVSWGIIFVENDADPTFCTSIPSGRRPACLYDRVLLLSFLYTRTRTKFGHTGAVSGWVGHSHYTQSLTFVHFSNTHAHFCTGLERAAEWESNNLARQGHFHFSTWTAWVYKLVFTGGICRAQVTVTTVDKCRLVTECC